MKSIHLRSCCALLLLCGACDSSEQIASACEQGVCPRRSAIEASRCLLSEDAAEFVVTADAGEPAGMANLCVPSPLDGDLRVSCDVRWILPAPDSEDAPADLQSCDDRDFLAADDDGPGGETVCLVQQLSGDQVASGASDGWYYEEADAQCVRESSRVAFTEGALPPPGVSVRIHCLTARAVAEDGSSIEVDAQDCPELAHADGADVGAACTPQIVPPGGFDRRAASVEVGTDACQSNVCLVYRLDGDPSASCEEDGASDLVCASAQDVAASVYCSCRCDAPPGYDGPTCECPDDFVCVDLFSHDSNALAGGYCVRQGPAFPGR